MLMKWRKWSVRMMMIIMMEGFLKRWFPRFAFLLEPGRLG
jgi:hypothetical protein